MYYLAIFLSCLEMASQVNGLNVTKVFSGTVPGSEFESSLAAKIVVCVVVGVTLIDFLIQTIFTLYVFCFILVTGLSWKDRLSCLGAILLYLILRSAFLPSIITPLPFPEVLEALPSLLIDISSYVNLTVIGVFMALPPLACLFCMFKFGTSPKKMTMRTDTEFNNLPTVVILMPIYNEEPDALFRAIESAVRCDYPSDRKHVFLAFDDDSESTLFLALQKKMRFLTSSTKQKLKEVVDEESHMEFFPPRLDWDIEGVRLTMCRFPHGGKSPTQGKAFDIIYKMYGDHAHDTLVMFIDSDIILHENSVHNFVNQMSRNPEIRGLTGLITCRTSRVFNLYHYLQDAEYVEGQIFMRSAEALLGSVTCLPGALTLLRLSTLAQVAPKYFVDIDKQRNLDYHHFHLGEDRCMTYLITEITTGPYQVQFLPNAQCKTEAPDTFSKLLKQRRRWFLGGFTNDLYMLANPTMWRRLPFLMIFKACSYSSRSLDWLLIIFFLSLGMGVFPGWILIVFSGLIILKYLLLVINVFLMSRKKVSLFYLVLFFVVPVFNAIVVLYSIYTWRVRSWGGPRTDSGPDDQSQAHVLDTAMEYKEKAQFSRRTLKQMAELSRSISNVTEKDEEGKPGKEVPFKKFVPFPYEANFLGGGEFEHDSNGEDLHSKHSDASSIRSVKSSRSGISTVSDSYGIGKLPSPTLEKASSFRLDLSSIGKMETLAVGEDSRQRSSSFSQRLAEVGSEKLSPPEVSITFHGS